MEVICINDHFSEEAIKRIPNRPVEGKLYTIRDSFPITTSGKTAVHLVEITNPMLVDEFTGLNFEPSFDLARFATLNGDAISAMDLKEDVGAKVIQLKDRVLKNAA